MLSDAETAAPNRASPRPSTNPGDLKQLGKYQIERKLGAGGMGTVYLARDTAMRRAVALKVLPKDKADNPILVKRFQAEAQAAAQLTHDNIVAVYDTGSANGYLYIAMEYIDGIDLHELINKRGPIPVKRSIEIIKQVASALQHASEKQIVHRDIKPSNLLIRRDGMVKLTDLGLARSVDDTIETGITRAGTTVGTVDYMAPEQAKSSKAADIRSDIYSLGCTWYHMLTGGPPYPEGSLTNKLQAHASRPLPDPRTVNDQVTDGLVAVLHRMMAKKPEDRYQTPAELLKDLEGSMLTKAAFSQEILEAIDEDSATDIPAHPSKPGKPSGGSPTLPPPRRRPLENEDQKEGGLNLEKIKLGIIAALVVGGVAFLVWLISNFGNLLDGPSPMGIPVGANVKGDDPAKNQVAVAPVGGAPVGGATIASGTEVAPIFSGTTILQPGASATGTTLAPGTTLPGIIPPGTGTAVLPGTPGAGVGTSAGGTGRAPGTQSEPFDPLKAPDWVATAVKSNTSGTGASGPGGSTGAAGVRPKSASPPPAGVRSVTVGAGASSATNSHTLAEGLSQPGPDGVAIQLLGNGPYVINQPVELKGKQVSIFAGGNARPLIVLAADDQGRFGSLSLAGGTLELRGVHLTADAAIPAAAPLVAVRDGALLVSESSVTVTGPEAASVTVFSVAGSLPGGSRVLLDQTVVRGSVKSALELQSPVVDAVLRESLLAVGDGSAVRFQAASVPSVIVPGRPPRSLRCFHSTLVSRGRVFDFSGEAALSQPPAAAVALAHSACGTASSEGPRILLDAAGWKQDAIRDAILWKSVQSAVLGFDSLVDFGSPPTQQVKASTWRAFWRGDAEALPAFDEVWPQSFANIAEAPLTVFDSETQPASARKVSEAAEPPGAAVSRLKLPDALPKERLAALAHRRPIPPALLESSSDKTTVRVDLKKEDLGNVIAKNAWDDGAVIEAAGFGVCSMTPVQLTGRSLKIVFRQVDGAPLRLVSKDSSKETEALFRIEQGTLVLDGLRWQGADPKPGVPHWLVSANNASVVLRHCDLQGPERALPPFQGIVRVATDDAPAPSPPALLVTDSFLHSSGTLVRVEAGFASVFVRNSVLVARGTAFDVRPRAVNNNLPLLIDLVQSTFAANQTVFQWQAASLSQPPRQPARVFVDGCLFGPPFSLRPGDASQPTVFTWSGPVFEQKQVEWWGLANGVAAEVKYMLHPEGSLPAPEKGGPQAWDEAWGPGREVRLLSRAGDVILAEDKMPAKRDALKPKSYELHPNSKAVVWADGRAIGADVASLEDVGPEKTASAAVSGTAKPSTAPTTKKTVPTVKPNPKTGGF
jgi:serine/threonine-protein kinase